MKWNKTFEGGTFEDYLTYLNSVKEAIPKELFEFISDSERHDLKERSLHDAWLEECHFKKKSPNGNLNIKMIFLGAYHDRRFHFIFNKAEVRKFPRSILKRNDDLITFEVEVENLGKNSQRLLFRAFFACGAKENYLLIAAQQIQIKEILG